MHPKMGKFGSLRRCSPACRVMHRCLMLTITFVNQLTNYVVRSTIAAEREIRHAQANNHSCSLTVEQLNNTLQFAMSGRKAKL